MQLMPLTEVHVDAAEAWMREIELRHDGWRDADTRSVIAYDGHKAVGTGMMWSPRVHRDRYWATIAAVTRAPNRRRVTVWGIRAELRRVARMRPKQDRAS